MSSPLADIFAHDGPRWYSIPAGRCFLDDLARGLCHSLGEQLPSTQILTPTRRGARALAQSFSLLTRGGALLLPQIRAIGDLDEGEPPFDLEILGLDLPPALSGVRRRFELARLVLDNYNDSRDMTAKRSLELADSLAKFFDSLALEEVDASDKLDSLVAGDGEDQYQMEAWAEHWQISARFLKVAVHAWPKRLEQLRLMDPSERQVTLIRRLVNQWRDRPPATPLILAGTTGSAPSTADLANIVARAQQGAVVLPGLDLNLADDVWKLIEDSHPQNTMKRMLDRHGVDRGIVRVWPASIDADRKAHARRRLLNEALRPAEATKDWLVQIANLQAEGTGKDNNPITEGLQGLCEIATARDEEAASVIALLMRETLETPDKVVALVTPDQGLARRVSARLTRWGLQADSSAGDPLANSLTGQFLLTVLRLLCAPYDSVAILALFNHPFSRLAHRPGLFFIERHGLRGAPPNDLAMITALLQAVPEERSDPEGLALWADYAATIDAALGPVSDLGEAVRRVVALAESLCLDQLLWAGAPGALASELFSELIRESAGFQVDSFKEVHDILGHVIGQAKVRTGGNTHPRLLILGAIEARLVKADCLILAGLEEGVWPQAPELDPFLSRPMRARLGLPSPERRTGLSAHDFVQAASAPEVYLITRSRREGEPQVQSRWLWRLQTLCAGAGVAISDCQRLLDWARAMDRGLANKPASLRPAQRPNPKPPVTARPAGLSVTEVELLVRDPYAIYAKKVIGLRPLDRPNEPVEARQRGTAIHASLERFVRDGVPLGQVGADTLRGLLEEELAKTHLSPSQLALQKPLLPDMAENFVAFESERRANRPRLRIEERGELTFATALGDFTLVAKADRIEIRDDAIDILDFKTGLPASAKQVMAGFYPQLTLTAAIIKAGGFTDIGGKPIGDLVYVRVAPDATTEKPIRDKDGATSDDLADAALASLKRRLEDYASPTKGYLSWTAPQFLKTRGGDYDQLARLYEWYVLGDDEAGGDGEEEATA